MPSAFMGALCIRLSKLLATSAPPFAVLVLVARARGRAASGRMGRCAYVGKSEDVAPYAAGDAEMERRL